MSFARFTRRSVAFCFVVAVFPLGACSETPDFFPDDAESGGSAGMAGGGRGGATTSGAGGTSAGDGGGNASGSGGSSAGAASGGDGQGGTGATAGDGAAGNATAGTAAGTENGGSAGQDNPKAGAAGHDTGGQGGSVAGEAGAAGAGNEGPGGTGASGGTGGAGAGGTTGEGGEAGASCNSSGELCNGLDDDCSGVVDDDSACEEGCTAKFREGHVYMFCLAPREAAHTTYGEARAACEDAGETLGAKLELVRIESEAENDFLKDWIDGRTSATGMIWHGANDLDDEHTWVWGDDDADERFFTARPMGGGMPHMNRFNDWATGRPNATNGEEEDCGAFDSEFAWSWNDIVCSNPRLGYVCEQTP
jgi:hypothetical protein